MVRACIVSRKLLKWNYRIPKHVETLADAGYEVTLVTLDPAPSFDEYPDVKVVEIDSTAPPTRAYAYIRNLDARKNHIVETALGGLGSVLERTDQLTGLDADYEYDVPGILQRFGQEYGTIAIAKAFTRDLPEWLFRWDFDVVEAHDAYALDAGAAIAETTDARLVADIVEAATERSGAAQKTNTRIAKRTEASWLRGMYKKCDAEITIGEALAAWTAEEFNIEEPIPVRNCRPRELREVPAPYDIREVTGVSPTERLGVIVGTIRPTTGEEPLLRALSRLDEPVHIAILSPGYDPEYVASLETTATNLRIEGQLHFPEAVEPEEVPSTIAPADFGYGGLERTTINHYLALPNRFFEYVTAQIPLVVPDYPDMGGLTKEYGMGVTFPEVEPDMIAAALTELFENQRQYETAVEEANGTLCWETEAKQYLRVFSE
jgi:glycosyltransferase involved in cell wall biosynthesis